LISISGADSLEAWLKAAEQLVRVGGARLPCMLVIIENPSIERASWFRDYNPGAVKPGLPNFRTIATMLAPRELLGPGSSRAARYEACRTRIEHLRARGLRLSGWRDTYFERLTRFPGSGDNQLEIIVDKLTKWGAGHRAALYAHIDGPPLTKLRPRGGPCLQYIQFGCNERGGIDLTALYRSHDYFQKALGNFVGLSRLLRFACNEAGQPIGTIRCISLNAHTERKAELRNLIN
jgi:hypothetical protein